MYAREDHRKFPLCRFARASAVRSEIPSIPREILVAQAPLPPAPSNICTECVSERDRSYEPELKLALMVGSCGILELAVPMGPWP